MFFKPHAEKCISSLKMYIIEQDISLQAFHLDIKYILEEIAQPLQQSIVTGKNITAI